MKCLLTKISLILLIFLLIFISAFLTRNNYFILGGILIFIVIWSIYNQIHEHYQQDDPKLKEIKKKLEMFFDNKTNWEPPLHTLNGKNIMKDISLYRGNKSYTINKEKIYICLKDEKGEYYNDNTLYYVIGHELSHAICDEIGHTEKFHLIFDALLLKMTEEGFYNPDILMINDYCKDGDPEII